MPNQKSKKNNRIIAVSVEGNFQPKKIHDDNIKKINNETIIDQNTIID
tara:strand:- start:131 stop:274 length:144 start_codon:yes stop_codon:yes gene_type:complete